MSDDPAAILQLIRVSHRRRRQWLRAELAIENAIHAVERSVCGVRTDAEVPKALAAQPELAAEIEIIVEPMRQAALPLHAARCGHRAVGASVLGEETRLRRYARRLPVWPWAASVRGFGELGLAQIVGEAGDLANYANPAKLWKRMGLAVLPDGTRQRNIAGVTAEQALAIGYVARRRSTMAVIGDSLMKGNGDGPYRTYYLAEKERQRALHPELRPIAFHSRALRHMEKRLLVDLWAAWRRCAPSDAGSAELAGE